MATYNDASAYSITKTVVLSVSLAGIEEIVRVNVQGGYRNEYYYNFPYAGFDTKTVDFSEIPAHAAIESVSFQKSGDSASGSKSYALKDEEGQTLGNITSAAIEDILSTGSRIFKLQHGFQSARKGPYVISQGTMTANNTITYTITVNYEASSVLVNYGTKDGWKQCAPYYCSNGIYVPVQPYYGINGEWMKAGASDD